MHTHNTPLSELDPHIVQFNELTLKLDTAVKEKNKPIIESTKQELDTFFGQLTLEKQTAIRTFLEQQKVGQTLERYRGSFRGRIHNTLESMITVASKTADTIPKLAEETVRLIVSTVGHAGVGIYKGGRSVYQSLKQAS